MPDRESQRIFSAASVVVLVQKSEEAVSVENPNLSS